MLFWEASISNMKSIVGNWAVHALFSNFSNTTEALENASLVQLVAI